VAAAQVSHNIMKNPMTGFAEAALGKMIDHSARAGFLKYKRQTLRFYAVWDDRESLYGDLLAFRIHYFLADDTIEVRAAANPTQHALGRLASHASPVMSSIHRGRQENEVDEMSRMPHPPMPQSSAS
jgi:hypothetical protein